MGDDEDAGSGGACKKMVTGILLVPICMCALVWNEFRTVYQENATAYADEYAVKASCEPNDKFDGKLVFLACPFARLPNITQAPELNALRPLLEHNVSGTDLVLNVDVYQWVQKQTRRRGSTTYYKKEWRNTKKDPSIQMPSNIQSSKLVAANTSVWFGKSANPLQDYYLSGTLRDQILDQYKRPIFREQEAQTRYNRRGAPIEPENLWVEAAGQTVQTCRPGSDKDRDDHRGDDRGEDDNGEDDQIQMNSVEPGTQDDHGEDRDDHGEDSGDQDRNGEPGRQDDGGVDNYDCAVGDVRVQVEIIQPSVVSLIAKQVPAKAFAAVVQLSDDELAHKFYVHGLRLAHDHSPEYSPPESKHPAVTFEPFEVDDAYPIDFLYDGELTLDEMISKLRHENTMLAWAFRIGGWFFMGLGFGMIVSSGAECLSDCFCFGDLFGIGELIAACGFVAGLLLALPISIFLIATAWATSHPFIGIPIMALSFLVCCGFKAFSSSRKKVAGRVMGVGVKTANEPLLEAHLLIA